MQTEILKIDAQYPDIEKIIYCGKLIRDGGLVVFPTETVYGIAADYSNKDAVKRLYEVKRRSINKPFSILIAQPELISNYTNDCTPKLYKLSSIAMDGTPLYPAPLTACIVVIFTKSSPNLSIIGFNVITAPIVEQLGFVIIAPSQFLFSL